MNVFIALIFKVCWIADASTLEIVSEEIKVSIADVIKFYFTQCHILTTVEVPPTLTQTFEHTKTDDCFRYRHGYYNLHTTCAIKHTPMGSLTAPVFGHGSTQTPIQMHSALCQ